MEQEKQQTNKMGIQDKILNKCDASCCKVITLLLKKSRNSNEENDVQLILSHEGTHLHKENGAEYIEIDTKCRFLTPENKCSIYEKRFNLCRRYECEKMKSKDGKEMKKCFI